MEKYIDEEVAIKDAERFAAEDGQSRDVIYCHRSHGYYIDEAPSFIRSFEDLIHTTK